MDTKERDKRIKEMAELNPLVVPSSAIGVLADSISLLTKKASVSYGKGDLISTDDHLEHAQIQLTKLSKQLSIMRNHLVKVTSH